MSILTRLFRQPVRTARVAEDRLLQVLTQERALPVPVLPNAQVTLKQALDGLLLTFGDGAWTDLIDALAMQLEAPAMRDLFDGARVRVEAGKRVLSATELEELSLLLAKHRMVLNLRRADAGAGASRNLPLIPPEELHSEIAYASAPDSMPEPVDWVGNLSARREPVLLLRHSLVAGQMIHYGGTIVILGDVSPAAQVVAERDVIVLGRLRGVAHAGSAGSEEAIIAALYFTPTQARIAHLIAQLPSGQHVHTWPAEMARVHGGKIIIQPWSVP